MRKLAVIHDDHYNWVSILKMAEKRIDIRGWRTNDCIDKSWISKAEGLFTWKIPVNIIKHMSSLKWIQVAGAGIDHIINDPHISNDIKITRADGQFGFWISRYVLGHLLYETQHILDCQIAQKNCSWHSNLIPEDLTGKIALIFGFGRIGRHIGRALAMLGMDVHGFVRSYREDHEFQLHNNQDLAAWLPLARVLVISAPLTKLTRDVINLKLLHHGNQRLMLINVGRGELVNIDDLLEAIRIKKIDKAILDVFPDEPLDSNSILWHHPSIIITPHHSGPSTYKAIVRNIMPNLRRFADDKPIKNIVDRNIGY